MGKFTMMPDAEHRKAADALISWFASQQIPLPDAMLIMAYTTIAILKTLSEGSRDPAKATRLGAMAICTLIEAGAMQEDPKR